MIEIESYTVEKIKDPYGILSGDRYEFRLDIEIAEDDDIYVPGGLYIRLIYRVDGEAGSVVKYELHLRENDKFLDIELEDEEETMLKTFCGEHFREAEE